MNFGLSDLQDFFRRVASGEISPWRDSFAQYLTKTERYGSEQEVIDNFSHLVDDVRKWLKAKNFSVAEDVMNLMLHKRRGQKRRDGSPSALHEITQAVWFISCVEDGLYADDPEAVLSVIFAHDLGEDFDIKPEELRTYLHKRGHADSPQLDDIIGDFDMISKRFGDDGEDRYQDEYHYFHLALCQCRHASIAKLIDRAHNIMTLIGAENKDGDEIEKIKMMKKIAETMVLINDMCRDSATNFPRQAAFYSVLKHVIDREAQVSRYFVVNTGKTIVNDEELRQVMPKKGFIDLPNGFHPLIVPAQRIRHTYPETHLAQKTSKDADLDRGIISGSGGGKGSGSGSSDSAGGAAGSRTGTDDIPDLNR